MFLVKINLSLVFDKIVLLRPLKRTKKSNRNHENLLKTCWLWYRFYFSIKTSQKFILRVFLPTKPILKVTFL